MDENKKLIDEVKSTKYEYWNIEKIIPYARNPRKNDFVVDKMVGQIKEFGMPIPICIRPDGTIVDGHLRFKAAKKLNLTEVPVAINQTWTPEKVKAFRISANRSATWAEWDKEFLSLELQELEDANYDLLSTGFDEKEINDILGLSFTADNASGGKDANDEYEEEENPHVKMIQLFYDEETEKNFRSMISFIEARFGSDNLSDTVYSALQYCAEGLEKQGLHKNGRD